MTLESLRKRDNGDGNLKSYRGHSKYGLDTCKDTKDEINNSDARRAGDPTHWVTQRTVLPVPKSGDEWIDLQRDNAEDVHVDQVGQLEVIAGGIQVVPVRLAEAKTGRLSGVGPQMSGGTAYFTRATR